jgi:hypothetical protein
VIPEVLEAIIRWHPVCAICTSVGISVVLFFAKCGADERPNDMAFSGRERAARDALKKLESRARSGQLQPLITVGRDFPPDDGPPSYPLSCAEVACHHQCRIGPHGGIVRQITGCTGAICRPFGFDFAPQPLGAAQSIERSPATLRSPKYDRLDP